MSEMAVDPTPIRAALPEILACWRGWLRQLPDDSARAGERGGRDQALVAAVIDAAFAPPADLRALRELERVARAYGAAPRERRLDPDQVSEELALLRHAIWRCVQGSQLTGAARLGLVGRLDHAITVAVTASLHGCYSVDPERDQASS